VPESLLPAVARLVETMPVVIASRTGAGASLRRTYGYPGGEIGLLEAGLVPAGLLDARKARIALALALSFGLDPAEVFAHFA
jgi:L-asparaginase